MVTLPKDVAVTVGLTASLGAGVCLSKSLSSFSRIWQVNSQEKENSPTYLQSFFYRYFGKAPSVFSDRVRHFSEGVFWAVSSVAFGSLAMLTLDPEGKHTPSKQLQDYLTIHQSPALISEEYAIRLNPLEYRESFVASVGKATQTLAKSVQSYLSFIFPSKSPSGAFVSEDKPQWAHAPLKRLRKELSLVDLSLIHRVATGFLAIVSYKQHQRLSQLESTGRFSWRPETPAMEWDLVSRVGEALEGEGLARPPASLSGISLEGIARPGSTASSDPLGAPLRTSTPVSTTGSTTGSWVAIGAPEG